MNLSDKINQHYAGSDFSKRFNLSLQKAGLTIETITPEDIARFDQFHIRGKEATRDMANLANFHNGMHVLDVGCGLGGPARILASEFGCYVTGIDITQDYCRLAELFNRKTGLANKICIKQADATMMPFVDEIFDAAVTEHVTMNILNKELLLKEIFRVLKPGGKYGYYEIFSSDDSDIYFPVPWAESKNLSFLSNSEKYLRIMESSGFNIHTITDLTQLAGEWFKSAAAKLKDIANERQYKFSLAFLMKNNALEKTDNLIKNFDEGKLKVIRGLAIKSQR